MFIGSLYLLKSAAFCLVAALTQGWGWFLLWPGGCYCVVGLTYFARAPGVLGKSDSGQISPLHFVALWPYFLFCRTLWAILTTTREEDPYNEIAPGIFMGRRLLGREFPDTFTRVIDLTAEFTEPAVIRMSTEYHSFRILDGSIPSASHLLDFIHSLGELEGTTFIHCAVGHGRSGMFCSVLLLVKQLANDPDEALRMICSKRPGVWLREGQRGVVDQAAKLLCDHLPTGP